MNNEYAQFLENHPHASIHQSIEWGDFQKSIPYRGDYFVITDDENIGCSALFIKHKLPFGKCYLYAHRGPLFNNITNDWLKLLPKIKKIAKEQNAIFVRIDPPFLKNENIDITLKKLGFRYAHAQYQPLKTLVLDLNLSEKKLLEQMKPKGRYNIKIAKKHNVEIVESINPADVSKFYYLLKKTTERDRFNAHPQFYYENFLKILGEAKMAKLFLAKYNGKVIAGLLNSYYLDTAIYYFGASDHKFRKTMAPYLLQWHAILDAKKNGLKKYDFLGIAENDDPNHHWAGVTQFKKKFGGTEIEYIGAYEIILKPFWFWAMRFWKKFRG